MFFFFLIFYSNLKIMLKIKLKQIEIFFIKTQPVGINKFAIKNLKIFQKFLNFVNINFDYIFKNLNKKILFNFSKLNKCNQILNYQNFFVFDLIFFLLFFFFFFFFFYHLKIFIKKKKKIYYF